MVKEKFVKYVGWYCMQQFYGDFTDTNVTKACFYFKYLEIPKSMYKKYRM